MKEVPFKQHRCGDNTVYVTCDRDAASVKWQFCEKFAPLIFLIHATVMILHCTKTTVWMIILVNTADKKSIFDFSEEVRLLFQVTGGLCVFDYAQLSYGPSTVF